jgi:hypothetical protein
MELRETRRITTDRVGPRAQAETPALTDAELSRAIAGIHEASRGTYGRPRIHAELRYSGTRCSSE